MEEGELTSRILRKVVSDLESIARGSSALIIDLMACSKDVEGCGKGGGGQKHSFVSHDKCLPSTKCTYT